MQATINELKEVNIGSIKDSTPIFINANLPLEEENAYTEFLKEFIDIFSQTQKEMLGLDRPKNSCSSFINKT